MKVIITGAAGFIGMHTCKAFLDLGYDVIGIDNYNDYYSVTLKYARVRELLGYRNFHMCPIDIANMRSLSEAFKNESPDLVVHLAAQAGVRYSIENPEAYIRSNLVGFANILECCRQNDIKHLVYASSSSVYGDYAVVPFKEAANTDHPVSLYAATKKSNEILAYSYYSLYGINMTGLRFFTVYGPWGRPDMAPMLFADAIVNDKPIEVFNNGDMRRDFTYIDDIVAAVTKVSTKPAGYEIFNIGNNNSIQLTDFIECLERLFGRSCIKRMRGMQQGDVKQTYADSSKLYDKIKFSPQTKLEDGLSKFVDWYKEYYKIK